MRNEVRPNPALGLCPVRSDPDLPDTTDVVVIGGGLAGVSAAWHLARLGLRAVICEKGEIGAEQSGRNWGWCRNTLRTPAEIPLMRHSMHDWRDPSVFGALDTGFRTTGIAYLTGRNRGDEAVYGAWLKSVAEFGLGSRMLSARELAALVPGAARAVSGAIYTAEDGCAEPGKAAPAIAEAARRLGVTILTRCAVRSLETEAGAVSAVITERGRIGCRAVLLAGGIWSRRFLGNLGVDLPMLKVMGSVMFTKPMPGGPDVSVAGRRFGWRRREDGGYIVSQADATILDLTTDCFRLFNDFRPMIATGLKTLRLRLGRHLIDEARLARSWQPDEITPFEQVRIAAPEPMAWVLDEARLKIAAAWPFFAGLEIAGSWGGYIDVTPDTLPVIGAVPQQPGLFLATGLSGHGFGLGPGVGRLAADLVAGVKPVVDPFTFRPERFARAAQKKWAGDDVVTRPHDLSRAGCCPA